ncbi:hypothetical protein Q9L58_007918 [Maublancomyces gigas]|uniref:GPI inositol-deacylase winged helix domain-containing protein n=1 Tax=Discina gigas TaxID=1032678 RepID=A0ABR3GBU7_9PEZI
MFQQMGSDGINIFMTSRPLAEIQRLLTSAVNIKLSAQREDIVMYLEGKITNLRELKPAKAGLLEKYKDRVISGIAGCADEMFLLVRFYFEFLCQQYNAKRLLLALETLKSPSNSTEALDLCYQRVIKGIREQEDTADLALSVLSWLVKAKRPLKINELQEALAVERGVYELDQLNLTDVATLVDVCGGLVPADPRNPSKPG